jgi:dihydroorotase
MRNEETRVEYQFTSQENRMKPDVIIRGGRVIDPASGIDGLMDVAIAEGKILALDERLEVNSTQVLDAGGKLVCPGLIDIHAHVSRDLVSLAVDPDEAGVSAGVTTVNDAGSVGYLHLHPFRKYVISQSITDVFVFLNISPFGEIVLPEVGFDILDETIFLETIEANRDIVRGIKVRAIGELIYANEVDVIDLALRLARKAGLPLMVHLGMGFHEPVSDHEIDAFITRILGSLEKGDILTHAFTDKPGGIFRQDGTPLAGLEKALNRGVYLDAAPGRGHINLKLVRAAIQRGFMPQAFGTDVVKISEEQPHFYNVAAIASKFIALGLSLNDAIAAITCSPAKMLGEQEKRGSIKPGMQADLCILDLHEGDFLFHDGRAGNVIAGSVFLSPQWTVKSGEIIPVRPSISKHIPERNMMVSLMQNK